MAPAAVSLRHRSALTAEHSRETWEPSCSPPFNFTTRWPGRVRLFMARYNEERTHQGKRCQGRTPMQTFLDSKPLAEEKRIA